MPRRFPGNLNELPRDFDIFRRFTNIFLTSRFLAFDLAFASN